MIAHIFGQAVQEGFYSTSSDPVNIMESYTNEDKSFETWKKTIGQRKQRGLSREDKADEILNLVQEDCESVQVCVPRVLAVSAGGGLGFLARAFTERTLGGSQT